jgi:GT2 family glycosyltransferase
MVTCSVVLYNTSKIDIHNLLNSFKLIKLNYQLIVIDNSPTNYLKCNFSENIIYIHNPLNKGFGYGHNIAFVKAKKMGSKFHAIINPDIYFNIDPLSPIVNLMLSDMSIGVIMPNILNSDDTIQFLPKLLPSPFTIIFRKLKILHFLSPNFLNKYEFRNFKISKIYELPILSGCFSIYNMKVIDEIGFFDDQFFLYFEDWDLSRRINIKYKSIFYPNIHVYHNYKSEANFNFNFFMIYLKSAIKYFNKWGWFFDKYRYKINSKALLQFEDN